MLESPKAQAVYRALQSSSGFSSSAGNKAAAAISKATDLQGQIEQLMQLPDEGIPPAGGLPVIIPSEIKAAVAKLDEYKGMMGGTISSSEGLSSAISQRMENVTGNMAMMNAAAGVAQKMGDVPEGCGALGAAFSVLTSEGQTDALNALMGQLGGPLAQLKDVIDEALDLNSSSLPGPLKAALDEAMAAVGATMASIGQATAGINSLVGEAQSMWAALDKSFTEAVQSTILVSMFNNPCLGAVIDAVSPPEVSDILHSFE
ncbi:DUF7217 family protein [Aeromonas sp. Y311-2]|uniref:DUF7217 family protein n=1 Tax=Aeromonas sp. Y311-2 TaxID=2990507 RepID=UPI0022DF1F2E|nr:hypothetical protein [Aeromonas sp. Y311-2]